ncbi:hypothetical protein PC129_g8994 [Phytophthora cactorum]|uniref:Uncharacterized protein n=1 Tax=Phytophthora cactorum TaxID=29920 RepID=A0A8T1I6H9_9STRA|nr:hypothetical protein PC111_g13534 [Phytophthora cactorum]KAG2856527.1 hypothetical protein PC113_g11483 [Phytophthora cactorum]KAG2900485.1 hypothetical protein PC114_g13545 [Phytophthora cactorum]KAG3006061.1 hypothetical protein PC120_g17607 [Phytophthora cactorum]KAG3059312.1 hypothetical protein PC121_g13994 [Phytophthora cactorum]
MSGSTLAISTTAFDTGHLALSCSTHSVVTFAIVWSWLYRRCSAISWRLATRVKFVSARGGGVDSVKSTRQVSVFGRFASEASNGSLHVVAKDCVA